MHYIPGTPWYDAVGTEFELEIAAGYIKPAPTIDRPGTTFRPVLLLGWLLGIEFALVSVVLWLA